MHMLQPQHLFLKSQKKSKYRRTEVCVQMTENPLTKWAFDIFCVVCG
jgi:hypothetical protein